jgi:hypothetical protein
MNNKTEGTTKGRLIKKYEELINYGVRTAAGVLVIVNGAGRFQEFIAKLNEGSMSLRVILPIGLFLLTILLGFSWFLSGKRELEILQRYYGRHAPNRSFSALVIVIVVASMIVLLTYYSSNLFAYASLYLVYVSCSVYASWLASQHVLKAYTLGKTDETIPKAYKDEVYRFYVKRPSGIVGYWTGTIAAFALACAIASKWLTTGSTSEEFEIAGYLLLIVVIIVSDMIIWSWRRRFYKQAEPDDEMS